MNSTLITRLQTKSIQQSIITNIARDFNLTPILAEAYFHQIKGYFLSHADIDLSSGKVHYLAISDNEPPGKPIVQCRKVSVALTLHNPEDDLTVYKDKGLYGLRHHRLLRMTKEALEQGAVLSYEDVAFLLTTSVVTIKRDVAVLRRQGLTIPSRGWRQQMGRGQTHKVHILDLYLSGDQFSEIEQRTHHSETAVKRYIQDFTKIILLREKKFSVDQIRARNRIVESSHRRIF